ncbi:MAG: ROK family protein [Chloroflexota bacterium]
MTEIIIALDVGGSSVKSGIVDTQGEVSHIRKTPVNSQGDAETILNTFALVVQSYLTEDRRIKGIGVGFPSPFDYDNGICLIEGVQKYEAIYGINIGDELLSRTDLDVPIRFRNDAEAALVGEAIYGAGKPYDRFIGVTLGTGMGSSFIAERERVSVGDGIPEGGFLFPVHFQGEQADEWFSTRGLLRRFADDGYVIDNVGDAATFARAGNDGLAKVWDAFGRDMGLFLHSHLQAFQAEALLVSGGIAAAYDLFADGLITEVSVPVVCGALGEKGALLGAAALI